VLKQRSKTHSSLRQTEQFTIEESDCDDVLLSTSSRA